jgi:DNA-binding MarR family transcriptional regulator
LKINKIKRLERQTEELHRLLGEIVNWIGDRGTSAAELDSLQRTLLDAGLRQRHTRVLLALALSGPLTIGELARRLNLTSATTSLLTGELDRAGFLARREDDTDRRRTIVSLPEHIRVPLEQVANAKLSAMRRALEHLDPPARKHFLEGLRLLATEAAAQAPARRRGSTTTDRHRKEPG